VLGSVQFVPANQWRDQSRLCITLRLLLSIAIAVHRGWQRGSIAHAVLLDSCAAAITCRPAKMFVCVRHGAVKRPYQRPWTHAAGGCAGYSGPKSACSDVSQSAARRLFDDACRADIPSFLLRLVLDHTLCSTCTLDVTCVCSSGTCW
jgi:hypothetical protein